MPRASGLDVLFVVGAALIVAGVAEWSRPAAYIVAGSLVLGVATLALWRRTTGGP